MFCEFLRFFKFLLLKATNCPGFEIHQQNLTILCVLQASNKTIHYHTAPYSSIQYQSISYNILQSHASSHAAACHGMPRPSNQSSSRDSPQFPSIPIPKGTFPRHEASSPGQNVYVLLSIKPPMKARAVEV